MAEKKKKSAQGENSSGKKKNTSHSNSSGTSSTKKKSSSSKGGSSKNASASKNPSSRKVSSREQALRKQKLDKRAERRAYISLVLLFLAFFSILGYFNDAVIISWVRKLICGLIGPGYWLMPFSMLCADYLLFFKTSAPKTGRRSICFLLIPVMIGSLFQVMANNSATYPDGQPMEYLRFMWSNGQYLTAGGIISGTIGRTLAHFISSFGAFVLLFLITLVLIFHAFGSSTTEVIIKIQEMIEAANERAKERDAKILEQYTIEAEDHPEDYPEETVIEHEPAVTQVTNAISGLGGAVRTNISTKRNARKQPADLSVGPEAVPDDNGIDIPLSSHEEVQSPHLTPSDVAGPSPTAKKSGGKRLLNDTETGKVREKPFGKKSGGKRLTTGSSVKRIPFDAQATEDSAYEDQLGVFERTGESIELPDFDSPDPIPEFDPELPDDTSMMEELSRETIAAKQSILDDEDAPASDLLESTGVEVIYEPEPKKKVSHKDAVSAENQIAASIEAAGQVVEEKPYVFPSVDLLEKQERVGNAGVEAEMRNTQDTLADTINSFGINANIKSYTRGPSVARFEMELERGVKLSKLTNLSDDIALALGVSGVRIAPVPDKPSMVGIEIPNRSVTKVMIRSVIESDAFRKSKSTTAFAVGKDIAGNSVVGDISKLPHLLIAGTTGSGKSVCINSILISLLYKSSPDDVKLIMIDPKKVELGGYNGIPHLLIPVVTEPNKASGALQWAVVEMMRRYSVFADNDVRKLSDYNKLALKEPELEHMPSIVVVIDELADLMMVAAKEVEESICRIAQLGRAAGIHLVVATQRPSTDVITGLMKANIPSRIAFTVASAMESRIIMDTAGAEKLVGKGDMLYHPIGTGKPLRVQGCMISDEEVEAVVNAVKQNSETHYDEEIAYQVDKNAAQTEAQNAAKNGKGGKGEASSAPVLAGEFEDCDELLPAAVDVIIETGMASVSMLQRRLKLGYARAARVVDQLEEHGFVGPFEGSKPRAVLITKEEWAQKRLAVYGDSAEQMEMELEIQEDQSEALSPEQLGIESDGSESED